jgi:transcription antitermination protein NusB
MISRRNIRVKVMQTLYTLETMETGTEDFSIKSGTRILNDKLNNSLNLFVLTILHVFRVAQHAEKDARQRASKYLPTKDDLLVSTKIAENGFMEEILADASFSLRVKESSWDQYIQEDWVKKIYAQLEKTEAYREYIETEDRKPKSEKAIIRIIWEELFLANEKVLEHFEDEWPGFEDDKEMILMLMENFFKNTSRVSYSSLLSPDKLEYAHSLLKTVLDKKDYCMELIQPKLINWDSERVALVDLLLLRMGVCELLYFNTIPTKVTINEYIEIAKLYSTPQSGQFVNGVLDNILKDLVKENLVHKLDRPGKS